MVNLVMIGIGSIFVGGIIIGIIAFFSHRSSFRNIARIARQTGKDVTDVVWIDDKFRVRNRDGEWQIQFRSIPERTQSIPGKFWTKFVKPGKKKRVLKYSDEEWQTKDLSKLIQRGLMFYETAEGVLYPMQIGTDSGAYKLSILDQDNTAFVLRGIRDANSLTKDTRREKLMMIIAIVSVAAIAGMLIISFIYLTDMASKNVAVTAQMCGECARNVINATLSGGNEYVGDILQPGVGG